MFTARRLAVGSVLALAAVLPASPAAADLQFGPAAQSGFGVGSDGTATGSTSGDLADAWARFRATEEGQRIEASLEESDVVVTIEVLPAEEVAEGEAYGTSGITDRDEDGNVTHISIRIAGTNHLGSSQLANTIHHEMRHAEEQMAGNSRDVHQGIDADVDPLMVVFQGQSSEIGDAESAAQAVVENAAGPDSTGEFVFGGLFDELDGMFSDLPAGDTNFLAPAAAGDAVECGTDRSVVDPAADITGVTGTINGTMAHVVVALSQSAVESMRQFSWAVRLDLLLADGETRMLLQETHDGAVSVGEISPTGLIDATGTDIRLDDGNVEFWFDHDPTNPVVAITVNAFSTTVSGGPKNCDTALAPPFPFPLTMAPPTSPGACSPDGTTACLDHGMFAVTLTGPNGPLSPISTGLDDTVRFESSDGAAVIRVLYGCAVNSNWWVSGIVNLDEYEVAVTDTDSGEVRIYASDSPGPWPPAFTDTAAFGHCPPPPASVADLLDGTAGFNMTDRAVYRSDDFTILSDQVPPRLDEVRAGAVMIDGIAVGMWTAPTDVLDQLTVELDRFSGPIQNGDGIDLVGSATAALPYFETPVKVASMPAGETLVLMPFAAAGPNDTHVGIYFGTTTLGQLDPGTFAAIGGRLQLSELPLIGDFFREQLSERLGRDGGTIPDLLISVTPVIITDD